MPLSHYGVETLPSYDSSRDLEKSSPKASQQYVSGHFSYSDNAVIKSPKTERILKEKLKNIGYNINIILYETVERTPHVPEEYRKNIEDYMIKKGLQKENHITFVKNSTSGDLLSPWMLLHNLGHAVTFGDGQNFNVNLEQDVVSCVQIHVDRYFDASIRSNFRKVAFQDIFKFKSIQKIQSISQFAEVVHELVAEYLWHGKIRIDPNYSGFGNCLEIRIKKALDRCVGRIIYDWF